MSELTELLKLIQQRSGLQDSELNHFKEMMASFWFDTPAIIGTAKEEDLTRIDIPKEFAAIIIEEARKSLDNSGKYNKGSESYKVYKPYTRRNYNVSDDLEIPSAKTDLTVDTYTSTTASSIPPYVKYLRIFIRGEPNPELQKNSLKKIKFILARIIQAPDMKEWRLIDPDMVEINKLIGRYESLSKALFSLGFKVNKKSQWELKSSDLNIELLQNCLNYIKKILKSPTAIEEEEEEESAVVYGPHPPIQQNEQQDLLQNAFETITVDFKDFVLPRVRVLKTEEDKIEAVEYKRKFTKNLIKRRQRSKYSTEKLITDYEELLRDGESFLDALQKKKTRQDLEKCKKKIELLFIELKSLNTILQALPKSKVKDNKALNDHASRQQKGFEVDLGEPSEKGYAKEEYKKRLINIFPPSDFPADPPQNQEKMKEFHKIQSEMEEQETQIRDVFDNNQSRESLELLDKLKCYAAEDRSLFTIIKNSSPVLELDISKGESVQTVLDLIGLKLGLLETEYGLVFQNSKKSFTAMGKETMLKNLNISFYEVLELMSVEEREVERQDAKDIKKEEHPIEKLKNFLSDNV